jgi:Zn-dependent protease with chaperone function
VLIATALALSAFVPFLCARWSSRELLSRLDDPLLPDRLLAHSRRVGMGVGSAIGIGVFCAPSYLPAVVLLSWVSVLAGGFRARKAVFDERWGFFGYLDHTLRFWIGLLGSFALIATIPWAMSIASDHALVAGIAVGLVAWLWVIAAPSIFRALIRAKPLPLPEAEALSKHFTLVLQRATCRAPALYYAEARGGNWINAFALPAVGRPGVLFTRGFLDALTPGETAAIFAHEVAHLEHFKPQKVVTGRALAVLLVAIPLFLWAGPAAPFLRGWEWIWPCAFTVAMTLKAAKSRGHEAESDRRAVELCSDPDALVSGLTKLHALNRISRRWDAAFESYSTHPSLARRIRSIRAISGPRSEAFADALFLASDGSSRAVLFDSSRVHLLEDLPEDRRDLLGRSGKRRSYRYEDLHDLRLQANRELVLKSAAGETARITIRAEEVSAVQEALDRVDGLLGESPVAEAPTSKLWSLVLGLLALIPWPSWVVVALAAAVFARPSFLTLLALGASGLASAAVLPDPWWRAVSLALAATAVMVLAARRRNLPRTRGEALLATLVPLSLVLLSSLRLLPALFSAVPVMWTTTWASQADSAIVGLVAVGAVLLCLPRSRARLGGLLALAVALGILIVGSSSIRERFGGDVFASSGGSIPMKAASLTPIREVRIPGHVYRISLSPGGESVAVAITPAGVREESSAYLVEAAPGRLEPLQALALEYLDERRILFVERSDARAILKVAPVSRLESGEIVHTMPLLSALDLEADASGNWLVSGYDWVEASRVLVRGSLDSGQPEEIRFSSDASATLVAASRDEVLAERFDVGALALVPFFPGSPLVMQLEVLSNGGPRSLGTSMLMPQCFAAAFVDPGFYCAVIRETRTELFFLAAGSSTFEPLGSVPGLFYANEVAANGWLLLNRAGRAPGLFDRSRRVALELPEPVLSLAVRNDVLATARAGARDDESIVSLYTVPR